MCLKRMFGRNGRYEVFGEQGGLSVKIALPEGFDPLSDKCPMVILMHGFMASKSMAPVSYLSKAVQKAGMAALSFDFNSHGQSEGKFVDMTLSNELSDARAVFEYARALPYVSKIVLLGHSQGGVIAGLLAGELEGDENGPSALVQLAPAAVLKDDAKAGQCMGAKYNPADPPEYVNVFMHKLGRKFILEAQKYPIYENSSRYSGPVCLIHGSSDRVVPLPYSERYEKSYPSAKLNVVEGEGHFMRSRKDEITSKVLGFLKEVL